MNKKILIIFVIIAVIVIIGVLVAIYFLNNGRSTDNSNNEVSKISNNVIDDMNNIVNNNINTNKESEVTMNETIKVNINNKIYTATLEQNETAKQFEKMLPQSFNMNELNGNEKYVYLDKTLSTNSYNPKHIEAGDIMLYGNNCLVVFYKSFDTSYSYTKIGHIENLDDLGNKNVTIKFEK